MSKSRKRQSVIIIIFLAVYVVIVARLFYWEVIRGPDLKKIGEAQSSDSITLQAKRGDILASDGFPLATNTLSYWLYANPKLISNKQQYAQELSPLIKKNVSSISAALNQNLFWVSLARNLNSNAKTEIEKLNLKGVGFETESQRLYPEASLAAKLVGFVGKDINGNSKGYFGVEGYYNDQLQGRDGRRYVVKDALGNPVINDIREEQKIDGRTVQLTIDRTIQFIAERKLEEGIEKYGAASGSVLIMDPNTGKVLAMASFPNFDPQHYWDFPTSSYDNPIISSVYEPGSTFKVLVMSAAIDKGLLTPQTRCNICAGPVKIDGYEIKTWDDKYFPNTTMNEVIQHSDNTGMVFVARKLGLTNMLDYFNRFGLGELTGIDLQGETTGIIRDKNDWHAIDLATAGFGQGISVTPLQLLNGVNAIANGGKIMKPYVVQKIYTDTGNVINISPQVKDQAISETTSQIMTWVMVNAAENGESSFVNIKGLLVAGKTGTAQIPVAGHYDPTQTNASFVGFFPADHPKISMLVILNKPKTSIYGAETAAPIFFNITKELINYLNIPLTY